MAQMDTMIRSYEAHGLSKAQGPEGQAYRAWMSMRYRCYRPSHAEYKNYGGRGIGVCERWAKFSVFLADMGTPPDPTYSLDRIDNDGPYSPENCRWATKSQQTQNRRPYVRTKYKTGSKLEEMKKLQALGLSTREIGLRVGLGKSAVWKALKDG